MRVLATNISAGLTATTFAAALVSVMATGLTPSTTRAATMQDHACVTAGGQCGETTRTAPKKKTPNLAARALTNKVVMDVMLGNVKSNPELTVGCSASGICVTLIPEQQADPDHVGVPGILALTSDSGSGPQSFPSPPVDTAFIAGAPATGRFAGTPGSSSAGRFAARAASTGPTGSSNPGGNSGSGGGGGTGDDGNTSGGGGNGGNGGNGGGGNGGNGGGGGDNADNGNGGGGNGDGDNPGESNPGPQDPIIIVFEPIEPIKVPEPSTLFIFGFALLAMGAFGVRQTQTASNGNRAERTRR